VRHSVAAIVRVIIEIVTKTVHTLDKVLRRSGGVEQHENYTFLGRLGLFSIYYSAVVVYESGNDLIERQGA